MKLITNYWKPLLSLFFWGAVMVWGMMRQYGAKHDFPGYLLSFIPSIAFWCFMGDLNVLLSFVVHYGEPWRWLDEWGLTYRRIPPGYEVYGKLGIYQRNLSNFDELPILENTAALGACLNCHTVHKTNPNLLTSFAYLKSSAFCFITFSMSMALNGILPWISSGILKHFRQSS